MQRKSTRTDAGEFMKFSVITVCLNSGQKLIDTVNNILEQSFGDFEVIIKDGGSEDGSIEAVRKTVSEKVKIFSTKDSGIYAAMNEAVQYASGEYVLFLNSGDKFFDKDVLKNIAQKELPAAKSIIYGDTYFEASASLSVAPPKISASVCYRNIPCHQAILYSRDVLVERGFDTEYRIRADYEHFLYSFFCAECKFTYLGFPVCRYEGNGFSESASNKSKDKAEYRKAIKKYIPLRKRFIYRATLILTLHKLRGKLARSKTFAAPYQAFKAFVYKLRLGGKN